MLLLLFYRVLYIFPKVFSFYLYVKGSRFFISFSFFLYALSNLDSINNAWEKVFYFFGSCYLHVVTNILYCFLIIGALTTIHKLSTLPMLVGQCSNVVFTAYILPRFQYNVLSSSINLKGLGLGFVRGTINLNVSCSFQQLSLCGGKNPPCGSLSMCVLTAKFFIGFISFCISSLAS